MPEAKIYKGLQSPKNQEKLRNARLCNNDKSALYLSRQSVIKWLKRSKIGLLNNL